jgi:signal transduction histidine kinase
MINKGSKIKKNDSKLRVELSEKTFHLKIEASLERVLLTAMKMKKPDDLLNVCQSLFKELTKLGFTDLRSAMINIHNDKQKTLVNYNFSDAMGTSVNRLAYNIHPVIEKLIRQIKRTNDALSEMIFEGKDLAEWKKFRKKIGEKDDPGIKRAKALCYYFYSIGTGSIGISSFTPVEDGKLELLKRFRNVFNLAYQRYADIALAHAQANEARIEASLEKVRAQALGMHKPNDLLNICTVLFKELLALGFTQLRNAIIHSFNDDKKYFIDYDYSDDTGGAITNIPYNANPIVEKFIKEIRKSDNAFVEITIRGKELKDWKEFRKKGGQPDDLRFNKASSINFYCYSTQNASIGVSTFDVINEEKLQLLKRFRNVFDLAYRRYRDLQKAEAQAREAQIQLALEKVRAITNAMQKSDELPETTFVLFQQLRELGEMAAQISLGVIKEEEGVVELSATVHGNPMPQVYKIPIDEPYVMKKAVKAWKAKQKSVKVEIKGQELKRYNQWRNSVLKKKIKFHEDQWIVNIVFFSRGLMSFSSDKQIPHETWQLLERFAAVFDQTYTRFLDLKRAEAQAREAQIEAALERVRSRSLAMRRSDELQEVVHTVFEKLKELNVDFYTVIIVIFQENSKDIFWWLEARENQQYPKIWIPYSEIPYLKDLFEARESGCVLLSKCYYLEEKNKLYHHLFTNTDFKNVPEKQKKFLLDREFAVMSTALAKNTGIHLTNYFKQSFSEAENEILQRFAKVFDQAYTRFLDLQKAEEQAKEAKIEAALEKIRSRSLAMHHADELIDVITVLREKLKELDIAMESRTVLILTLKQGSRDFTQWVARPEDKLGKSTSSCFETPYFDHPILIDFWNTKNNGLNFLAKVYTPEEKNSFFKNLFKNTNNTSEEDKNQVSKPGYYGVSAAIENNSAIIISSLSGKLLSEKENEILKRFSRVFEQAYIRFLDLQNAEAQAREAEIELGLERVRARAMAMQKSGELSDLVDTVFKELTKLDFALKWCIINIIDESTMSNTVWAANLDIDKAPESYHMLFEDYPFHHAMFKGWKERNAKCVYTIEGEEKRIYDDYLFSETEFKRTPKEAQAASRAMEKYVVSFTFSNFGGLQTVGEVPLSDANLDILSRFGKVFDLTYTRFNDLQKAEAQAREAKIEAALERVRSRTMAMHKSDDLLQVITILSEQIQHLGFNVDIVNFNNSYWKKEWHLWSWAKDFTYPHEIDIPYFDHPYFHSIQKTLEAGLDFSTAVFTKEEKNSFQNHIYENALPDTPTDFRESIGDKKGFAWSVAFCKNTSLTIANFDAEPYTEEQNAIVRRFANVFEQSYTRFLDLQKAESQAREAEIELGLERVRARAMSMQTSEELGELIGAVFTELTRLDLVLTRCVILIYEGNEKGVRWWMANSEAPSMPMNFFVSYANMPFFNQYFEGWQNRTLKWQYILEGENKVKTDDFLFNETGLAQLPDFVIAGMRTPERVYLNASFNNFGNLTLASLEPLSDEHFDILLRFAKVFDLTYTRFNDLKQAEAQARESQIQLALERVRARTMAMQHSDELKHAAALLFQQVKALGAPAYSCGYNIWEENEEVFTSWMSTQDGSDFNAVLNIPLTEDANFIRFAESRQKGEQFFVLELRGERMQEHYQYLKTIPEFKAWFDYAVSVGFALPETQIHHIANFSHGNLLFITLEPCFEFHEVFKRFAAVFEQTYTRFLDLQKAEAQAREAQIELGLERVRARAMAMQKSEELVGLIDTVQKELTKLEFKLNNCILWIMEETPPAARWWVGPVQRTNLPESYMVPFPDLLYFNSVYKAWKERIPKWTYVLENEDKYQADQYLFSETALIRFPEEVKRDFAKTKRVFVSFSFYSYGGLHISTLEPLAEEQLDVIDRFSRVFDMTYTRFLDLQKAEAQAREAQIQLALERVRARTMAMQKSDELGEAAGLLFKQVSELGIKTWTTGFNVWSDDNNSYVDYITTPQGNLIESYRIDATKFPVFVEVSDAKKRGEEFWIQYLEGDLLRETYKQLSKFGDEKQYEKILQDGFEFPSHQYDHFVFGSKVSLMFITYEPVPEALEIFKRFGKVFEQTYTRFLDLQKAEAQAREAKIETALEKVRSRSLAMHTSDELKEVVKSVFERLSELNIELTTVIIVIFAEDSKDVLWWLVNKENQQHSRILIKYEDLCYLSGLFEARKSGKDFFTACYSGQGKKEFYDYLFEQTDFKYIPEEQKKFPIESEFATMAVAFTKNIGIHVTRYSDQLFSEKDSEILKRFARVFDQAYVRFLDLQKAEAQAREAKIEAALERVRSRTMAMFKSDELAETAAVVFQQLISLGIEPNRLYIGIINDESGQLEFWITDEEGNKVSNRYMVSIYKNNSIKKMFQGWTEQRQALSIDMVGNELNEWATYWEKEFGVPFKKGAGQQRRVQNLAYFSKGFIATTTFEDAPKETTSLLNRFAAVFNLTYTRFSDLQQAEAQAREAKIEAALERVRSRTMGMQKSEELKEVIQVVYDQFVHLDINIEHAGFVVDYKAKDDWHFWIADKHAVPSYVTVPYLDSVWDNRFNDAKEKGIDFFAVKLDFEEKNKFYQDLLKHISGLPEEAKEFYFNCSGLAISTVLCENVSLYIENFSGIPYSDEENATLMRFGKVFQQTYTRFLDLQKAEVQAREAQIEASLERVRSKAMAMHNSNDISTTTTVVFVELERLGIQSMRCGVALLSKSSRIAQVYAAATSADGELKTLRRSIEMTDHPSQVRQYESWLRQETYIAELKGDELKSYYHLPFFNSSPSYVPSQDFEQSEFGYYIPFSEGLFYAWTRQAYSESELNILNRFKAIIDLTFRRFLDLQKAEAQAREAQIEAALERVRSKAMAMHKTEDFHPAVAIVFEELDKLDLGVLRCGISVLNKEKRVGDVFLTSTTEQGSAVQVTGDESFDIHPLLSGAFDAWLRQEDFDYVLEGDDVTNYYKAVKDAHFQLPESQFISSEVEFKRQYAYVAVYHAGGLFAFRETEFPEEAKTVMKRFANVFDLTYKRFQDLQKAEAQAREAKIEAAMEKVRGRAMAMQKADELVDVAQLLRKEMGLLGVEELETSSIYIHHDDTGTTEYWYAIQDVRGEDKKLVADHMTIQLNNTWVGREMLKFYNSGETKASIVMQGQNRKEWINNCAQHSQVLQGYYGDVIPERTYHLVKFSNGYMGAASPGDISAESWDLLKRATNVFSLAYTRFSDLKLAEAQAREATIEAALERVRAKAMAMHNSDDVSSAASMVFTELRKLGINPIRSGVGLLNNESLKAPLYSSTSWPDGDSLSLVGWVMLEGHPVLEKIYEKWLIGEDYFPELSGESLKSYYTQLLSGLSVPVPDFENEQKQYGHFFSFSVGCLYAWSDIRYNDDEIKILKRFASIIDLTFRRYMDLQRSEANAREAVKRSALDRIRADIASMRTLSDLDRITPLIWSELTILGLPFIRCGIFLMDESQKLIHTFLSTPDGKAIGAFHMPYDTPILQQVLVHWRANERYIDHWDNEVFVQFANTLLEQGAISSPDQYLKSIPAGGFHLHFLPFLQGMLYVGNTSRLTDEQINLVQAVAEAFSTAYARYEDFNRLEAAKEQIEKTLVDLKQTQQQLIQSEKMASLGELTAGIAHEIQNPLNFVNNFSEVSNELLDEMKHELATGNGQSAIQIVDDVKQNLEKILHHGKRADAIVKGMLQHSRTSSGQKELTDINALADEYLRLAYHGLRAKDKTFNAKFEIELDKSIEKINIVPQEIGRVILNLINNAFYTVSEKKQQLNGAYEPTVVISTRKLEDKVEVKVKDNGNGIPQKVMEKIFQPFFTTKPTGQGTGLGLSLSYDIITKGHGGELRVQTKEGEGSEFVIQLPNS